MRVSETEASAVSSTVFLRIANRVRRVRGTRPLVNTNRAEAAGLEHPDELQPDHLEQRQERDDEAAAIVDVGEELFKAHRIGFRQALEQLVHPDFHRDL